MHPLSQGPSVTGERKAVSGSDEFSPKLLRNHRAGRPDSIDVRQAMVERLATEHGTAVYAKRKITVETVFGNITANLGFRRFSRRGLDATSSEWRLVCTVHNLLKIHRQRLAAT
ncbi:MAG: transposase [Acidimicrobiia bacterium]